MIFVLCVPVWIILAGVGANGQPQSKSEQTAELLVVVVDENGVAVPSARLTLQPVGQPAESAPRRGETDDSGRYKFTNLGAGPQHLRVEKEGFYAVTEEQVRVGETESVEVTLNHQQEYVERVNVTYSPPAIDPAKTVSSETLSSREIIDLPYTVDRDIRYALPLLPGVLQDAYGQVHVDGSSTRQVFDRLDGFNITDPVDGFFNVRVSVDALRSADVQGSRYPVEFGKGSGGILSLTTGMGDDRFRFTGTDFLPSLQSRKGIHVNSWTPRGMVTGPIRKGRAWFLDALEGEYDLSVIPELPVGADRSSAWRFGNLAKAQVNLTPSNILTSSFLVNHFASPNYGLDRFDPIETTSHARDNADIFDLKDLAYLSSGTLLETGVAFSAYRDRFTPQGDQPYFVTPEGTHGNYFESAADRSVRLQAVANLVLPPAHWAGRHEFKLGADLDRLTYDQSYNRRDYSILREDGTLERKVAFIGNPTFGRKNTEISGYAQDRWSLSDRVTIEPGLRLDWDDIVHEALLSPRLASSVLLTRDGNTKIVTGAGIYYDASSLAFITSPLTGQRLDYFYDPTGTVVIPPPVETSFHVQPGIKEPRFLNWSAGVERKLPGATYVRLEFLQKRGRNGWTYINQGLIQTGALSGLFDLENQRRDKYDSLGVTVRRTFKGTHSVFASYTRSAARSNAVLNFNLENPLFSQQAGGPLPWDAPNRFQSWGFLPLWRKFDLAYIVDWRDGFPFSLYNENQELVGRPDSRRFPDYFSLNLAFERRFNLFGFQWALRAGCDDITNRRNPTAVNSNVDSPQFLTFGGIEGRVLTSRIRLLGRK